METLPPTVHAPQLYPDRARDTRLQRDVALKLLPDVFASDSGRLARFQREAQVLASLNHPNIAAIYGLEESKAAPALVMELVDGPTLAERIGLRMAGASPSGPRATGRQVTCTGSAPMERATLNA